MEPDFDDEFDTSMRAFAVAFAIIGAAIVVLLAGAIALIAHKIFT